MDREEFVEAVLSVVEHVPPGRVTTYGAIADHLEAGGPRRVGSVLSQYGGPVPWWRVVRADGSLPPSHGDEARQAYLAEGTPLRSSGRPDMPHAFWAPPAGPGGVEAGDGADMFGATSSALSGADGGSARPARPGRRGRPPVAG